MSANRYLSRCINQACLGQHPTADQRLQRRFHSEINTTSEQRSEFPRHRRHPQKAGTCTRKKVDK